MITRRMALQATLAAAAYSQQSIAASGPYPYKPITLIVPFAAGNVTDGVARLVGDSLAKTLGQAVVIDNRVGASGMIGMSAIKRGATDGYTLGLSAIGPMALNPALYKNLSYDPLRDYRAISIIYQGPMFLLVDARSELKSVQDVLQLARKSPAPLQYTTPGVGSSQHLTAELFASSAGVKLQHIPSKGSPQAATMLLGGLVPLLMESATPAQSLISSGQMRPLAISTPERAHNYPSVPTFAEAGLKDVSSFGWLVVVAPANTPQEPVERISQALKKVMAQADISKALESQGAQATWMDPQASTEFVRAEQQKWGQLIRKLQLSLE